MKHAKFFALLITSCSLAAVSGEQVDVIHDAHIHYSQDVWEQLPPSQALRMLRKENIQRALVSSTPSEGTELLYREDPELVVPLLRPYKSRSDRYVWFKDPELKSYLLSQLKRIPYRGFGEFHVNGKDANSSSVSDMIALARERNLILHAHANFEAMQIILNKAADIKVIWAHGGFDVPVETLIALLEKFPLLHIELSFREGMLDGTQLLTPQWKSLLTHYHTRFMVGADTYLPSRWAELSSLCSDTRHWLNQLPENIAEDIARHNFDRVFSR